MEKQCVETLPRWCKKARYVFQLLLYHKSCKTITGLKNGLRKMYKMTCDSNKYSSNVSTQNELCIIIVT